MKNIIPNIAGVFRTASRKTKKLAVSLGGLTFDEPSLFNNLIAFGVTGSGKRASVVYPILDSVTGLTIARTQRLPTRSGEASSWMRGAIFTMPSSIQCRNTGVIR